MVPKGMAQRDGGGRETEREREGCRGEREREKPHWKTLKAQNVHKLETDRAKNKPY